jgi:hypothetical protein
VTAPVPEPSTWLLVLASMSAFGVSGWRRRRAVLRPQCARRSKFLHG